MPGRRGETVGAAARRAPLPAGTRLLQAAFALSGVLHLTHPQLFEPIVPRVLPARRALVLGSGVAELVCAAGLQRRSPWAPRASALLLLAVWPANGRHALVLQRSERATTAQKVLGWARLPLQVPMVRTALRSPRH